MAKPSPSLRIAGSVRIKSFSDVALELGISENLLDQLILDGKLPPAPMIQFGRRKARIFTEQYVFLATGVMSRTEGAGATPYTDMLRRHIVVGTRPKGFGPQWSLVQLADAAKMSSRTIQSWLSGQSWPSGPSILRIQSALFGQNPSHNFWADDLLKAYLGDHAEPEMVDSLPVTRASLAEVASPYPRIAESGQLDAAANSAFDKPRVDDDLSTLPIRQNALISTICSDLPANAPRHLRFALEGYAEELKARGVQPILGLLKDFEAVITVSANAAESEEDWLHPGLREAFNRFAANHELFIQHFPLDPIRENLYAKIDVYEDEAVGYRLSEPFKAVAEATAAAGQVGLTTQDFVTIVDKMMEFARVVGTLPPTVVAQAGISSGGIKQVSAKKRFILSGFGFLERAYNIISSTITITATPEGAILFHVIGQALSEIARLFGSNIG